MRWQGRELGRGAGGTEGRVTSGRLVGRLPVEQGARPPFLMNVSVLGNGGVRPWCYCQRSLAELVRQDPQTEAGGHRARAVKDNLVRTVMPPLVKAL